jgi:hypothetical protein
MGLDRPVPRRWIGDIMIAKSDMWGLRIAALLLAAVAANAQFVQQGGKHLGQGARGIALLGDTGANTRDSP